MRSIHSLILSAAVLAAVIQPAVAGEAATDGAAALSADSVERLKGIGTGWYQITATRDDVPLVVRALQDRDLTISSHACLAVEKMAPRRLYRVQDRKALWESLRPKLRSQDDDTSAWSARGVGSLCRDTELLDGECLDEAFDETLLMLSSNGPEMRRRGVGLSRDLVKRLPRDKCETLVRALLAVHGEAMVTAALGNAAPKIETQALANEVAARLLGEIRDRPVTDFGFDGEVRAWQGLAYLAGTTSQETRAEIVGAILMAVADKRWAYLPTSGVLSPPKHADAEALAARKLMAARKAQPAAREEEDVAFFEKKYQKKLTGVKPKNEYSDPDQFYSAIGEQLGIPEIAWKAAAEKFGWKKDEDKQTFSMLKGGPTAGGGQGTWDVMFIRSKINPGTKRPDPATLEQVMVQIDYDGNIKFPEIAKGNR
jgi:hypothetical protein